MTIHELEEAYSRLHDQLLRGELAEGEFKAEIERLRFEDDQGRQWKIGWYTGQWYRYDQGEWLQDQPRERSKSKPVAADTGGPSQDRAERRGATRWLVGLLVGLLLVAAVVLVAGWWSGSTGSGIAAATESAAQATLPASDTPAPTSTAEPPAARPATDTPLPSRTPRPTATRPVPSASPTPSVTHTATATVEPSPTAVASPARGAPALSGRIFFPLYDPNPDRRTFDIYAVNLESGERELVVGQASQPALSPNGQRLAYRSWDSASRGIMVRELDDGHTWLWINFAEAARPSWSPDDQNIVFPSQQESDRRWRVYRSLGLEFDRVRRNGGDIFGRVPVWLDDGRIVYWECALNECGLYAMQSDGTHPVRLTANENDTAPAASPDGSQVAFLSDRDGNWEVYLADTHVPAGQGVQEPKRLTRNPARDGLPAWSPDGKWLAFATERDGAWAIWVMRPDGSGQRKLFDLGGPLEGQIALVAPGDQHGWLWETIAWGP